jgi:ferric-dicitrate binding protein FerR (iron transport regulator)
MHSIPLDLKQLLFDKKAEEILNPDEQAVWDEFVEMEQFKTEPVTDPEDPLFQEALRLYITLEQENIAPWDEFEKTLTAERAASSEKHPLMERDKTKKWSLRKVIVALAAAFFAFSGAIWLYRHDRSNKPVYESVITPNGKLDSVNLPDGTMVYVNAGSVLRYPASFTGGERRVELKGEAYFKIQHDPLNPFRVIIGKTEVKDLGTELNIKAYPGDDRVIITLLQGMAEVKHAQQTKHLGPTPGQQAIVLGNSITVNEYSKVENTLAWKQGFIVLEGETLQSVMQQIKRCYNVEFKFIGQPRLLDLTAPIPTTFSLAEVIKVLNDATWLDEEQDKPFHLEGNTIIIRGN